MRASCFSCCFFFAAVFGAAVFGAACGSEGPAVKVLVLVEEGEDELNTREVKSLVVRVGQDRQDVLADRKEQQPIELSTAPAGETEIVVFACTTESTCDETQPAFVGCKIADLQPSESVVIVTVPIFDAATPPDACDGLLDPE